MFKITSFFLTSILILASTTLPQDRLIKSVYLRGGHVHSAEPVKSTYAVGAGIDLSFIDDLDLNLDVHYWSKPLKVGDFSRSRNGFVYDLAFKFTMKYHVPRQSDSPYYFGVGVGHHMFSLEWKQELDVN